MDYWIGFFTAFFLVVFIFLVLTFVLTYIIIPDKIQEFLETPDEKCRFAKYVPYTSLSVDTEQALLRRTINVSCSNCSSIGPLPVPPGEEVFELRWNNEMYGYLYVLPKEKACILAFTGTFSREQWWQNIQIELIPAYGILQNATPETLVHRGFLEIYAGLKQNIHHLIQLYPGYQLYITGFSLGGALTTVASLDLAQYHPIVYSFASPRVFNNAGALLLDSLLPYFQRIYNTEDIIPDVPFPPDYTHTGINIPFTLNLGSKRANHVQAYLDHYGIF